MSDVQTEKFERELRTQRNVAALALLVAQWVPVGLRGGAYPFLCNHMFSSSL